MIKTSPHRPGSAHAYNPDNPLLCQRHIAYDLCQLVFDLIGAPESARRFRGPAGHFAAISKTLEERPNPAVGHYLDNQENLAKIERYFSTFEIAEELAEGNIAWRDRLTQAFQAMGPLLDTLLEETQNRHMLDVRWGTFIRRLRTVIERYLRDTPGPPPNKKDAGGSGNQGNDTKQPENEASTPPPIKGKKKIAKRIKSEDDQRREETDSSLKGEGDESTIPAKNSISSDEFSDRTNNTRPNQIHHYATNKNKKYSPAMQKIADKYGLKLDEIWNKESLPHQGRHPNAYHDFVVDGMKRAHREAKGDKVKFLNLFDQYVKEPVRKNPDLLRKDGWE